MLKAYKYRIYPNMEQRVQIAKTFGCCRFVYNRTLAYRKEMYEKEKKSVSKTDCNNYCNRELKKENEWLKEVDKFALTNAIYNMDSAYQKFFKEHAGYPKFKSKHDSHRSYTTNFTNGNIAADFERNKVKLPKLKEVKAKLHRNFSGQIKSAAVSQVPSGKYYVSLLVETEHEELQQRLCVFAQTGGEGSEAAFWLTDEGELKIIHMGSGSGSMLSCVLADNALDFLRLIAIGYDEICWDEDFVYPPNENPDAEVMVKPNTKFQNWVTQAFGTRIPKTALEVVKHPANMDDESSEDAFFKWIQKYM